MKKTRRLAIQVSIIVTLMFIFALGLIGFIVIRGTKNMYIESNNDAIVKEVKEYKNLFMSPDIVKWVVDEWEKDPDMVNEPASEIQLTFEDELNYSVYAQTLDMEEINSWDEETKRDFLKAMYNYIVSVFDRKRQEDNFEAVYCFDIRKYGQEHPEGEDDICVIFGSDNYSDSTGDHSLGLMASRDSAVVMFELLHNGKYGVDYGDIVYQELSLEGVNSLLYLAVVPVIVDEELLYVLCFEYDWSSFAHILNVNLNYMIIWGAICLILTNIMLILFIYLKAVRPTVKVHNAVREYIETKNSEAVVKKMSAVKAKNEFGRLADSISELAVEIDRYTEENLRLNGERERVEAELDLATKIQADMLPTAFPDIPELSLYASMDPAKEVGGDFYDFFFIDEEHLGLVIADVSGKGVPAALFMMMSKMLVKNYAMMGLPPAEVLNRANASICENNKNKMFVTVWFGVLDIATGHLRAANAGHEYPMVRKPGGQFEMLKDKHGFVLGAMKKKRYTEYEFDVEPGGTLFVYTDGAPEATNAGNELFGTERMLAALNRDPDAPPETLLNNMTAAINEFVGDAPQFDDLTMLGIKYNGKTKTEEQI